MSVRTTAIVITGPPGAGKSSVLEALATLLEIDGIAFGALESEHFGWGFPWLDGEPVYRQLAAVLELQRQSGRRLFLVAATTENDDQLAALTSAIAADATTTVLLTALADTVAERVAQREPDAWPGKAALVTHARELAVSMPRLTGIDIRLETGERTARETAVELRRALDHLLTPLG